MTEEKKHRVVKDNRYLFSIQQTTDEVTGEMVEIPLFFNEFHQAMTFTEEEATLRAKQFKGEVTDRSVPYPRMMEEE